jgi:hypothetical protein
MQILRPERDDFTFISKVRQDFSSNAWLLKRRDGQGPRMVQDGVILDILTCCNPPPSPHCQPQKPSNPFLIYSPLVSLLFLVSLDVFSHVGPLRLTFVAFFLGRSSWQSLF